MRIQDPRITERRNPRTADIDLASPLEIVDLINAEDRTVADAVASQREQIAQAVTRGDGRVGEDVTEIYASAGVRVDAAIGEAGDVDTALIVLKFASGTIGSSSESTRPTYCA